MISNADFLIRKALFWGKSTRESVVPTKQCGSIISASYISCLMAAHSEKSGIYKVKQGSIPRPALLCKDYPNVGVTHRRKDLKPMRIHTFG